MKNSLFDIKGPIRLSAAVLMMVQMSLLFADEYVKRTLNKSFFSLNSVKSKVRHSYLDLKMETGTETKWVSNFRFVFFVKRKNIVVGEQSKIFVSHSDRSHQLKRI